MSATSPAPYRHQSLKIVSAATDSSVVKDPYPEPQTIEELDVLLDLGKRIKQFATLDPKEQDELLSQLQCYECHSQVISLLQWRIAHRPSVREIQIQDGLWILKTQYEGLERFDDFLDFACTFIHAQRLSFDETRIWIAEGILGDDNWVEQSQFYKKVLDSIVVVAQQVNMLERLALIYEKKMFMETEVEPIYRRVLKLDPHNPKARRYFKMWYMQAMKWNDVAENLEALVEGARNQHERQRAAHELAQLYLYNLNKPSKAREVLRTYCRGSELDIRQTLVEALERLNLFDELIGELKKMELTAEPGDEQSRLKQKMGLVYLKAKRPKEAIEALRSCLEHNPHLLLAYESLINALIEAGQAKQIKSVLQQMLPNVVLETSKQSIGKLIERVGTVSF